jgi:hypothetical protein
MPADGELVLPKYQGSGVAIKPNTWVAYDKGGGRLIIRQGEPMIDIVDVLKRCREFVTDYEDYLSLSGEADSTIGWSYIERYDTYLERLDDSDKEKISDLKANVKRIEAKIKKRHREQKLREDIDKIIQLLTEDID